MRLTSPRRALKIALPTLAALGAGATVGFAAIPGPDGIHACIAPTSSPTGAVRIIDSAATCAAGETPIIWAQTGPAGPPGPPGPTGPAGADGSSFGGTTSPDNTGTTGTTGSIDTFATPTQAGGPSVDMFLKLDGVSGESTDDKHKNEIDLQSFAFGVGRGGDGTGLSTGTTAAGTKGRLQTLRIDKVYDASSPRLLAAATTGRRIKSAVLTFRRTNDSNVEFLTYTLSDVQVTSYDQGGKDGDARDLGSLEEEVGLTATRVHVTEQTVTPTGGKGPVVTGDWTVPKGAAKKG